MTASGFDRPDCDHPKSRLFRSPTAWCVSSIGSGVVDSSASCGYPAGWLVGRSRGRAVSDSLHCGRPISCGTILRHSKPRRAIPPQVAQPGTPGVRRAAGTGLVPQAVCYPRGWGPNHRGIVDVPTDPGRPRVPSRRGSSAPDPRSPRPSVAHVKAKLPRGRLQWIVTRRLSMVSAGCSSFQMHRARWRLRQRMASRLLLPSERLRAR
jgi:hypothetical protein